MVLVMNGDTLFTVDTSLIYKRQMQSNADGVIALRKVPDCSRYGKVSIDRNGWISDFNEKVPIQVRAISMGEFTFLKGKFSIGWRLPNRFHLKNFFYLSHVNHFRYQGIPLDDFLHIGVPADFERAQKEFGVIGKKYGLFR